MDFVDDVFGARAAHPMDNLPPPLREVHVYVIPPIEGWFGWRDLSLLHADSIYPPRSESRGWIGDDYPRDEWRQEVDRLFYEGRKLAERDLGYDGSLLSGPYLSVLPWAGESIPLVGWQSVEKEISYIAAPVALPYLEPLQEHAEAVRAAPVRKRGPFDIA